MNVKELELLAEKNRKRLVEVVYAAKARRRTVSVLLRWYMPPRLATLVATFHA